MGISKSSVSHYATTPLAEGFDELVVLFLRILQELAGCFGTGAWGDAED